MRVMLLRGRKVETGRDRDGEMEMSGQKVINGVKWSVKIIFVNKR